MSDRLRVFLVGGTPEDVAALRAQLLRAGAFDVLGSAVLADVQTGVTAVPEQIDAVVVAPRAFGDQLSQAERRAVVRAASPAATDVFVEHLTPRELAILELVADGSANREIARALDISEHTVKFHLASVFGKLGVSSRTEAVRRGLQLGLIEI